MRIAILLLMVLFVLPAQAADWKLVAQKWDGVSVGAGADEFSAPISAANVGFPGTRMWRFEVMCPTDTVVRIEIVHNGQTQAINFNEGVAITALNGRTFTRMIPGGATVDPEHVTASQNCRWDIYVDAS